MLLKSDNKKDMKKVSAKPIQSYSKVAPFFFLTTRPRTAHYAWKYIFTILKDFFLIQQLQKLHFTKRPVINVETDIDDKIPFVPDHVDTYLDFVNFFVQPMDMLKKRLGYKRASQYLCLYLKFLTRIYRNSSLIYRFCLTTTTRPKYYKSHKFRTIHFFDPHLLCVPSIHVAIAAGTYAWFKQCFKIGIFPKEEAEQYLEEIRNKAVRIVESVLFIKQHSVNCIPLALYMLSSTMNKSFFSAHDAADFIDALFRESPEINSEVRQEILEHFYYMYDRTLLESRFSADWQDCIRRWLLDFASSTGQKINLTRANAL